MAQRNLISYGERTKIINFSSKAVKLFNHLAKYMTYTGLMHCIAVTLPHIQFFQKNSDKRL